MQLLTYRVGQRTKVLKINEDQAKRVKEKLSGERKDSYVTLGLEMIQLGSIVSVTAEASDLTDRSIGDLRRRLIVAAKNCTECGGMGFRKAYRSEDGRTVQAWEPRCMALAERCRCQTALKAAAGIDPDDCTWHYQDKDFNSNYGRKGE